MPFVAFPRISESAGEWLEGRRAERDERRRERLHLLWLVASGAIKSRAALARPPGRNRETVGRWLESDAPEGWRALLLLLLLPAQRPGPASRGGISWPAEVQQAGRARLAQSPGEHPGLSLWRWGQAGHRVAGGRARFSRRGHDRLGAPLKVARPAPRGRKDAPLAAFRAGGLQEERPAGRSAHPGPRVGWWAQEESRFGLPTVRRRRRLTRRGVKPICPFEQAFENFWLGGAVQPNPGESFVLELPATGSAGRQVFLNELAAAHAPDPTEVQGFAHGPRRRAPGQSPGLARAGGARRSAGVRPGVKSH